jgi:hypothetical protein
VYVVAHWLPECPVKLSAFGPVEKKNLELLNYRSSKHFFSPGWNGAEESECVDP